ncbi:PD-(D/E)XK nuclease family protein [Candidatus Sumerlaeota bacterium]|nr:PD-(D/E)XK nuclease family protein [Candidatus Sumerlaeota bacterium]
MAGMSLEQSQIIAGGAYPELERAFIERVRELKRAAPFAALRVVVPNNLLGRYLSRRLAEAGIGHLNLRFMTMLDLMRELAASRMERDGIAPLPLGADRLWALKIVRENARNLRWLRSMVDSDALASALLRTFADLTEANFDPAILKRAMSQLPNRRAKRIKELLLLYQAWREELSRLKRADAPELGRIALHAAMHDEESLTHAPPCVFYGFYDLNAQQTAIIAALAQRQALDFFLPWRPIRAYATANRTLEEFERRGFAVRRLPFAYEALPAGLRAVREQDIFALERAEESLPSDGLTFVSVPDETAEARWILQRIRNRCSDETPIPSYEHGVLMRTASAYRTIWRDAFGAANWPRFQQGGRRAAESPGQRSLLLLLKLYETQFQRGAVMEFLHYAPWRRDALPEESRPAADVAAWEALTIECGVMDDPWEWPRRLKRLNRESESLNTGDVDPIEAAEALLAAIRALMGLPDDAPPYAPVPLELDTWSAYADWITAIYERWIEPDVPERDTALQCIAELAELDTLPLKPNAADALSWLRGRVEGWSRAEGWYERSGPCLCELQAARGATWREVYVPGLSEKSFPRALRQDPILMDADRGMLNQAIQTQDALELAQPRLNRALSARDEERMLFQLALEAGREGVTLLLPRRIAGQKETQPSIFVKTLMERMGLDPGVPSTNKRQIRLPASWLDALPPQEELRTAAFDRAMTARLAREPKAAAQYLAHRHPHIREAARLSLARAGAELTTFDGLMLADAALERIAQSYGLSRGEIGVTLLEDFANCPFAFFMNRLLDVRTLNPAERAEGMSPLARGSLLHGIYEDFYRQLHDEGRLPLNASETDELKARMLGLTQAHFARFEQQGRAGLPVVWRAERSLLEQDLITMLRLDIADDPPWAPCLFEQRFGGGHGARAGDQPFEYAVEDAENGESFTIRLRGIIDRVDRRMGGDGQPEHRIIDYKTGKARKLSTKDRPLAEGRQLQRPLYMLAAEALFASRIRSAEYRYCTSRGGFKRDEYSADDLDRDRPALELALQIMNRGLLRGHFFQNAGTQSCGNCPYLGGPCEDGREERFELKRNAAPRLDFDPLRDL